MCDRVDSIEQFIAALPKAELHLHLEGCVDADTLWELAVRQASPLVEQGRAALDAPYAGSDFPSFIEAYKTVCQHLETPSDYALVTTRLLRRLAAQNVRYAEIIVGVGIILRRGQHLGEVFSAIESTARQARQAKDALQQAESGSTQTQEELKTAEAQFDDTVVLE